MAEENSAKEIENGVMLNLPVKKSSLLSHTDNIDYALEQVRRYTGSNPVVGYFWMKGLGTKEILHQILPRHIAEDIRGRDSNFSYVTLDRLLDRKEELASGKYKVQNGLVIAFGYS